jgi:glycosyltransferase involved in cell wall biosynthesis
MPLVSISEDQRRPLAAHWAGTVYHGLPPDLYRFSAVGHGDYLAFLGRICPEKRVDRAIAISGQAGLELRIAAKVDKADEDYFDEVISPLLRLPHVTFLGEIADRDKQSFLSDARALLFPIDWPEPFGLTMIEAMACGTPVIAWANGSVPEVVDESERNRFCGE